MIIFKRDKREKLICAIFGTTCGKGLISMKLLAECKYVPDNDVGPKVQENDLESAGLPARLPVSSC